MENISSVNLWASSGLGLAYADGHHNNSQAMYMHSTRAVVLLGNVPAFWYHEYIINARKKGIW